MQIKGKTYKVTAIKKNAFKNCKKLKKVIIHSKNIKSIGKNAFKGIVKKAVFKVPDGKISKYKKLLKKSGAAKTIKVTFY